MSFQNKILYQRNSIAKALQQSDRLSIIDSNIIRLLRFPLAMMVVFLHADPNIVGWNVKDISSYHLHTNIICLIINGISNVLVQTAVPLFFLISGFLLFRNLYNWDTKEWRRKMTGRIFTILIPYVLWVAIFTAVHLLRNNPSNLYPWLCEQGGIMGIFWNAQHWIAGGVNVFGQRIMMSGPFAFHLWFLRDLIVMFALSPLNYLIFGGDNKNIKILSISAIIILGILYLLQVQTKIPGLNFTTIFYFSLGCFLSLNKISLTGIWYRYRRFVWVVFCILLLFMTFLNGSNTQLGSLIMPVFILIGCGAIIDFAAWWILSDKKYSFCVKYENTSFFLYIIHPFFLGVVWYCITYVVSLFMEFDGYTISFVDSHPFLSISLFLIKVALTALISILAYKIIRKVFPSTTNLLCGR